MYMEVCYNSSQWSYLLKVNILYDIAHRLIVSIQLMLGHRSVDPGAEGVVASCPGD